MAQMLRGATNDHVCELIRQALISLQEILEYQLAESVCSVPPANYTGRVGRPRFIIPREQLQHLIEAYFLCSTHCSYDR